MSRSVRSKPASSAVSPALGAGYDRGPRIEPRCPLRNCACLLRRFARAGGRTPGFEISPLEPKSLEFRTCLCAVSSALGAGWGGAKLSQLSRSVRSETNACLQRRFARAGGRQGKKGQTSVHAVSPACSSGTPPPAPFRPRWGRESQGYQNRRPRRFVRVVAGRAHPRSPFRPRLGAGQ